MWTYNNKIVNFDDLKDYYGFVYEIVNLKTGKKYIGKKLIWFKKTRTVKGKKKRSLVESDWMEYWGSNEALKEDISNLGKDRFKRQILRLCKSKGECNYFEAKFQFERDVLLSDDYYNSWITVKVSSSHLNKVGK